MTRLFASARAANFQTLIGYDFLLNIILRAPPQ
jgi:hypothetical protein